MIDINRKKTVIFDFGDTLASTIPTFPDRIKIALRNLGFEISDEKFYDAYLFADYQIYKKYISSGTIDSNTCQNIAFDTLSDRLKIDASKGELRHVVKQKLNEIGFKRVLLEHAGDLLELLKSKGFQLAIISNNDGYTREKCRELGIEQYFEAVVDSTKVGMVKPDSNIYRYTLDQLNVDADQAVHIGDLYGADVLGGINSGLDVIWYNHRNGENYDNLDIKQFLSIKEILQTL